MTKAIQPTNPDSRPRDSFEGQLDELLILAQSGNYDAFNALYGYLAPFLQRYAQRLIGPGQEAEDIVQDTLITLYTSLNRVQSGAHLRPYALRVARSRCYDLLRHWGRFEQVALSESDTEPDDPAPQPDEAAHWRLLKRQVDAAIERLPGAQREALLLYCADELSYTEIAEVVGATVGTVKSRLFYAKKTLRGMVHPEVLLALQGANDGRDDTTAATATMPDGLQDTASLG